MTIFSFFILKSSIFLLQWVDFQWLSGPTIWKIHQKKIQDFFWGKKSGHQYRFKFSLRIEWDHSQPLKITLKHSNLHPKENTFGLTTLRFSKRYNGFGCKRGIHCSSARQGFANGNIQVHQNISEILCNITQTLSFGSLENIFLRSKIVWSLYMFFIGWIDLNIMWTINSVINLTQRQQQQSSFRVSARTKTICGLSWKLQNSIIKYDFIFNVNLDGNGGIRWSLDWYKKIL